MMLRRPQMLTVGTPAPDFTITAHDGSTIRLAELQGKKVVLWFYPKANTGGWTAEGHGFRALYDAFVQHNVQILGISFDTVAENKAFADKFGFPFPLLCDTKRILGKAYGAGTSGFASRLTYIIDERGVITHTFSRVSPNTHAQEVLACVQQSVAGA
jgi:peroxiredoxin Q/BCP